MKPANGEHAFVCKHIAAYQDVGKSYIKSIYWYELSGGDNPKLKWAALCPDCNLQVGVSLENLFNLATHETVLRDTSKLKVMET